MSEVRSPAADPPDGAAAYDLRRLVSPRGLASLAVIGGILACIAGLFAYAGGWLTPKRVTPARIVDQFERDNGLHPGFRRNHPKGICFSGWFDSDGTGRALSRARVFDPGRTPVFGRFAIASGQPYLPDTPTAIHSMAVNFALRDGEIWRMAINGIPVFPAHTIQDFYDQLVAATPDPKTGKPDPARMGAFIASHPDAARAIGIIKSTPLASGFANTSYNSLNAFLFVTASGRTTPVRWAMVAEDPFQAADPAAAPSHDPNARFTDLIARVRQGPVRWRLVATIGQPGDPTSDPSTAWPADRQQLQLGVLTVDGLQDEAHGACRDVTFDPLILPAGIKGSDDPILSARSAAYARSFTRRSGEPAPKSAVVLPAGAQGKS